MKSGELFQNPVLDKFMKMYLLQKSTPFHNTACKLILLAFNLKFILRTLFQNPAIYYLHLYGNDIIIPANLFSDDVKTKIVEFGKIAS